jgi:hypothetical protein
MTANWPIPAVIAGSRRTAVRVNARRDLFENFQPFPAQGVFELNKAGGVSAGRRRLDRKHGAARRLPAPQMAASS